MKIYNSSTNQFNNLFAKIMPPESPNLRNFFGYKQVQKYPVYVNFVAQSASFVFGMDL